MKPERLTLRNIRAFGEVVIDFRDINACALVGQNGAGKSTIVEGILRALYSDGPKILPNSMIRLGATDGAVELEYLHNSQRYKVVRLGGKRSDVQFMVSDGNGGWQTLSGATSKETQEKINASLAMDEDLFLSSCCVMQGDSAGICVATPADRKAVMYRIFDRELSRFASLHDVAKRRVADLDNELSVGRGKRAQLEQTISDKARQEEARRQATETLQTLNNELTTAESELARLREAAARSQADREQLDSLNRQIVDMQRECDGLQRRVAEQETVIADCERLLSQRATIRERCDSADALERDLEGFAKASEQYSELGQAYVQATAARDAELRRIRDEHEAAARAISEKLDAVSHQRNLTQNSIDSLQVRIAGVQRQADLITEVPCNGGPMADECKLLAEARAARTTLVELRDACDRLISSCRAAERERDELDERRARLNKANAAAYEEARIRLQASVDEVLQRKQALNYDKAAHQQALTNYNSLKAAREQLASLAAAESKAEAARTALADAEHARDGKLAQIERLEHERDACAIRIGLAGNSDTQQAEATIAAIRRSIDQETRALASAETILAQIAAAEAELAELITTLSGTEHRRTLTATLQEAYSRDGIPALIIDAAIPAIEEHANELLSRLSDGRMSVRFATQRRTGSGIAETLDIYVADGIGERAYEDFSGGEQLRVNLAVRIAIGQILAQRSGATIRTLLLDEVCSPLDQAGEDALVECITKLQSMFDCILLITHRDSLKDRLPQQIEVVKGVNGSEVRVA